MPETDGVKSSRGTEAKARVGRKEMAASSSAGSVALARQELRRLNDQVVQHRAEATSTRSDYLGKALDKCNHLYDVTKHDARGAALDASFLSTTSMLGAEQAGNLERITPEKYISKLKAKYGFGPQRQKLKWNELAKDLWEEKIFELAPAATFIEGRWEAPQKRERQKRERSRHEPDGPVEMAHTVTVDKLQETAEDKAQVVRMKVLATEIKRACVESEDKGGKRRVCLFHALLHPTSFSQTVENFFDMSFLVKDGTAQLSTDANGMYLTSTKAPSTDEYSRGLAKTQNILRIDYATYKKLVQKWCTPDRPPMLKSREGPAYAAPAAAASASGGEAAADGEADAVRRPNKKARAVD